MIDRAKDQRSFGEDIRIFVIVLVIVVTRISVIYVRRSFASYFYPLFYRSNLSLLSLLLLSFHRVYWNAVLQKTKKRKKEKKRERKNAEFEEEQVDGERRIEQLH